MTINSFNVPLYYMYITLRSLNERWGSSSCNWSSFVQRVAFLFLLFLSSWQPVLTLIMIKESNNDHRHKMHEALKIEKWRLACGTLSGFMQRMLQRREELRGCNSKGYISWNVVFVFSWVSFSFPYPLYPMLLSVMNLRAFQEPVWRDRKTCRKVLIWRLSVWEKTRFRGKNRFQGYTLANDLL